MFRGLIESRARNAGGRSIGAGSASVVAHAAIIAGAVAATATVGQGARAVAVATPMVFIPQPRSQPKLPAEAPPVGGTLLEALRTIVPPSGIPLNIASVNLQEQFHPNQYTGIGSERSTPASVEANGELYLAAIVEEKPLVLAAQQPRYPEFLVRAGIQGRVVIQAIIDTTGRAEPGSIKILQSPSPGFDVPSREWIARALFRPGRVHGRAVRVLVALPINYQIIGR